MTDQITNPNLIEWLRPIVQRFRDEADDSKASVTASGLQGALLDAKGICVVFDELDRLYAEVRAARDCAGLADELQNAITDIRILGNLLEGSELQDRVSEIEALVSAVRADMGRAHHPKPPEPSRSRLVWGVVANAGRHPERIPRWAHVERAVGVGSTVAGRLCREAGFDPDEWIGGEGYDEADVHPKPPESSTYNFAWLHGIKRVPYVDGVLVRAEVFHGLTAEWCDTETGWYLNSVTTDGGRFMFECGDQDLAAVRALATKHIDPEPTTLDELRERVRELDTPLHIDVMEYGGYYSAFLYTTRSDGRIDRQVGQTDCTTAAATYAAVRALAGKGS